LEDVIVSLLPLSMCARTQQAARTAAPKYTRACLNSWFVAKGLLRHSSVSTTLSHYIKDVPEVTENAMTLVEELFKPVVPEEVQQWF
jgi:hypothetical protein